MASLAANCRHSVRAFVRSVIAYCDVLRIAHSGCPCCRWCAHASVLGRVWERGSLYGAVQHITAGCLSCMPVPVSVSECLAGQQPSSTSLAVSAAASRCWLACMDWLLLWYGHGKIYPVYLGVVAQQPIQLLLLGMLSYGGQRRSSLLVWTGELEGLHWWQLTGGNALQSHIIPGVAELNAAGRFGWRIHSPISTSSLQCWQ